MTPPDASASSDAPDAPASNPADLVLTPRAELQTALVDGELILFDATARQFHRLNPTASAVWLELDGKATLREIATRLAAVYDVDATVIEADCADLATDFDEQRLLHTSDRPEPPPAPWIPAFEPSSSPWSACHGRLLSTRESTFRGGPYRAFGFRFDLYSDDEEMGPHLLECLAPLVEEEALTEWPRPTTEIRTFCVRRPRPGAGPVLSEVATTDAESDDRADEGAGEGGVDNGTAPVDPEPSNSDLAGAGRRRLFLGGRHVQTSTSASGMADHLLWHVNRMAVETDTAHTMFHAAGASWDGAGILIPGHQNAGKSTLVTGLVEAGLGYLGDEAIALHPDTAWMLPFPKAIGLDRGSWPVLPHLEPDESRKDLQPNRWHVPPDRVRPGSRAGSVPVRFIICPRYEADVDTELQPMSDVDTVALLLEQAFHLADRPDALDQLVAVVEAAECYRLVTSDLAASVRLVCELVGAPIPAPTTG